MKKADCLAHWRKLVPINPLKHMLPIAYKSTGSSFGACGIRIDGTPEFIDAVLSNLKPLLDGENAVTRLELARTEVKANAAFKKELNKAVAHAEVCYIRLHQRGHEAQMINTVFASQEDREASERHLAALDS